MTMPQAPTVPAPAVPKGWDLDTHQAIGIGLGLVCLGLIIGFKLAGGMPPLEQPAERIIWRDRPAPCADCAEKKSRAEHPTATESQQFVPGDSSIPDD